MILAFLRKKNQTVHFYTVPYLYMMMYYFVYIIKFFRENKKGGGVFVKLTIGILRLDSLAWIVVGHPIRPTDRLVDIRTGGYSGEA